MFQNELNVAAKLAYYPDRHLTNRTSYVTDFSTIPSIAELMFSTLILNNGIALASTQCKLDLKLFVMRTTNIRQAFVNPTILFNQDEPTIESNELDLSFPGIAIKAVRYRTILIQYDTIHGQKAITQLLSGIDSFHAQQAMDYLIGTNYGMTLSKFKQKRIARQIERNIANGKHYQNNS